MQLVIQHVIQHTLQHVMRNVMQQADLGCMTRRSEYTMQKMAKVGRVWINDVVSCRVCHTKYHAV